MSFQSISLYMAISSPFAKRVLQINLADLAVTHITDLLDFVQPGLTDNHPNLTALRKAVKENPKIAQWIQDRPENTM